MKQEMFIYDKKHNQYVAKINNIEFCIDKLPTEMELVYITTISNCYEENLYKIANYMLKDNSFKEFFNCNNMLAQELIEKLNTPTITIINENLVNITYCNHTLDNIHIISLEFMGVFEKLAYLSIDG